MIKVFKDRAEVLAELWALLETEHGGCDDTTCSIQVAMGQGFDVHAMDCFASSGAASDEFYELWNSLPKRYRDNESRKQAREICKTIKHSECKCGAIVWETDWNESFCSSCGGTATKVLL